MHILTIIALTRITWQYSMAYLLCIFLYVFFSDIRETINTLLLILLGILIYLFPLILFITLIAWTVK